LISKHQVSKTQRSWLPSIWKNKDAERIFVSLSFLSKENGSSYITNCLNGLSFWIAVSYCYLRMSVYSLLMRLTSSIMELALSFFSWLPSRWTHEQWMMHMYTDNQIRCLNSQMTPPSSIIELALFFLLFINIQISAWTVNGHANNNPKILNLRHFSWTDSHFSQTWTISPLW